MQAKFVTPAVPEQKIIDDRLFGICLTLGKFANISTPQNRSDDFGDHEYTVNISSPDTEAIRHNHGIGVRLSVNGAKQRDVDFTCIALKLFAQENNIKCLISNDANTVKGSDRRSWFFCGDFAKLIETAHDKGLPLPFSEFAVDDILESTKTQPGKRFK